VQHESYEQCAPLTYSVWDGLREVLRHFVQSSTTVTSFFDHEQSLFILRLRLCGHAPRQLPGFVPVRQCLDTHRHVVGGFRGCPPSLSCENIVIYHVRVPEEAWNRKLNIFPGPWRTNGTQCASGYPTDTHMIARTVRECILGRRYGLTPACSRSYRDRCRVVRSSPRGAIPRNTVREPLSVPTNTG
jgi:hypothetical protein